MPRSLDHCHALITGASSGLGAEFARQLAPRAARLVLVARRHDRLEALQRELVSAFPKLEVQLIAGDLLAPETLEQILAAGPFDLLINNAGLGDYGEFASAEWPKIEQLLRTNIEALTRLSHALLPGLIQRRGAILNVSSLASCLPLPDFAVYAASKAYVTSFSEALRIELRDQGVSVLALCPGPIHTEFGDVARRSPDAPTFPNKAQNLMTIPPQECVRQGLLALSQDKARCFPGPLVWATAAVVTLLPIAILRLALATRPRR